MLKHKIRALAVTGTAIAAAAVVTTLSTTAASAAPTAVSAPGHVTAPRAADASGCVTEVFSEADEGTYEACVADEQVLLNDLYHANPGFADQLLTVDGLYGPDTANDVSYFQASFGLTQDGITGPQTWRQLCTSAYDLGYRGTYWHAAGCASEPGL
jgi:peptidoglycan hydrolase-like protein with peptidoglycan-binding domain